MSAMIRPPNDGSDHGYTATQTTLVEEVCGMELLGSKEIESHKEHNRNAENGSVRVHRENEANPNKTKYRYKTTCNETEKQEAPTRKGGKFDRRNYFSFFEMSGPSTSTECRG